MKFFHVPVIILFLMLTLLNAETYKLTYGKKIQSASELSYPPFSIVNDSNNADGFSVELLRAVVKVMGSDIDFYVDEWNIVKNDLAMGKIDVLPLVGRTPEREKVFDFSIPYLTMHGTVLVRDDDNSIKTKSDLKNKNILVMNGDNAHEYLIRNKISDSVITTKTFEEALQRLSEGEYDAVVIQKMVAVQLIKELGLKNIKPVDFLLKDFKQDFSFAVKEGNKELLAFLNEGLSIVMADGTYREIHDKWFSFYSEENELYKRISEILYITVFILIIIITLTSFWHLSLRREVGKKTKELQQSKELYADFFDNSKSANIIYETDDDGETFKIVNVNDVFEEIEGINRTDAVDKKVHELFPEVKSTGVFEIFKNVYQTGEPYHMPLTIFSIGGKQVWRENYVFKLSTGELVASYIDKTNEKRLEVERIENYENTLISLVELIEQRDSYTGGHSLRVANYSKMIAKHMGYSIEDCDLIYRAGILHDIGKIVTPDAILLKPNLLTKNEYKLIQNHVTSGASMLKKIPMYEELSEIVLSHHERMDGSGYPNSLKGEEIPLSARIMAVSDSFDAMTTNRIYKGRKSIDEALSELVDFKDIHYDSDVVNAAVEVLKNIELDNTSQLPDTEIEQQRFSFFFKDQLTDVYNQQYLNVILKKNQYDYEYKCLNTIFMHNFTQYNDRYGWKTGDELLKEFASIIVKEFPKGKIFRLHGDDFVLLNIDHVDLDVRRLEDLAKLKEKKMKLSSVHFHIENDSIDDVEMLDIKINEFMLKEKNS